MLTLPTKKKWFDMILSGEKPEEYRNITPYYATRFMNVFGLIVSNGEFLNCKEIGFDEIAKEPVQSICFRNGYSAKSPSFIADCRLDIGEGNPEWGAEPGVRYFILKIVEIKSTANLTGGKNDDL